MKNSPERDDRVGENVRNLRTTLVVSFPWADLKVTFGIAGRFHASSRQLGDHALWSRHDGDSSCMHRLHCGEFAERTDVKSIGDRKSIRPFKDGHNSRMKLNREEEILTILL